MEWQASKGTQPRGVAHEIDEGQTKIPCHVVRTCTYTTTAARQSKLENVKTKTEDQVATIISKSDSNRCK